MKLYECMACQYGTSKKTDYQRHCNTLKHARNLECNNKCFAEPMPMQPNEYVCSECERGFKDRSGLWKHKKKCCGMTDKALVLQLLKQNVELQKSLIEMSKEKTITTHNNIHNTTNNSFNLNVFLNHTCKDAMNISDFVSSIHFNLEDLENTGRQGYIEGISQIIVNNLNQLEQCFRPLHCSDYKREILYIKDNDQWVKETYDKPILTKAIKIIANENIKQIQHWRNQYPDCTNYNSEKNNLYLKIVSNSMNGTTEEEGIRNIHKIISNVAKEVTIDKIG